MNLITAPVEVATDIYQYAMESCIPTVIYNFTTYYEDIPMLQLTPGYIEIFTNYGMDSMYDPRFCNAYRDYIMRYEQLRMEFFSKLLEPLYNGSIVIILTNFSDDCMYLTECLTTIFQERYQYYGYLHAESLEDFISAENTHRGFLTQDGINQAFNDINEMIALKNKYGLIQLEVDRYGDNHIELL